MESEIDKKRGEKWRVGDLPARSSCHQLFLVHYSWPAPPPPAGGESPGKACDSCEQTGSNAECTHGREEPQKVCRAHLMPGSSVAIVLAFKIMAKEKLSSPKAQSRSSLTVSSTTKALHFSLSI